MKTNPPFPAPEPPTLSRLFVAACRRPVWIAGIVLFSSALPAADLRVLKAGLGAGNITSTPAGIACGTDCDQAYIGPDSVTLTATATAGTFAGWEGDCTGVAPICIVAMGADRTVRARFEPAAAAPAISDFTPAGLEAYLAANPAVDSPARFVAALPRDFRQNWILMARSESLQTGIAEMPRILLPNADARFVFTLGLAAHASYPGAHPDAIEYMQWDAGQKNFRFHEIVLKNIGPQGTLPARTRGVSVDDAKCSKCHSTRNVLNLDRSASPPVAGTSPGTDGVPPGVVQTKNKPNWDAYDSWGGMLPFNRDRIYQGSVEAAAFRRIFNLWNWRGSDRNDAVRAVLEQLELQPPYVTVSSPHSITRSPNSVVDDQHIRFGFDALPSITTSTTETAYSFGGPAESASSATQGGRYVTLRHSNPNPIPGTSNDDYAKPDLDEGRGVQLFDLLGGLDGNLNPQRIADELANHQFATGSVPIDPRPIALAIVKGCLTVDSVADAVVSRPPASTLTVSKSFFDARNGMGINALLADTRVRAESLPRRKADIQKLDLDRTGDPYLFATAPAPGQIALYGAGTAAGTDTTVRRIRNEVFRRPRDLGVSAVSVPPTMGNPGVYVDRELYLQNTERVALFRYFLEPLGVSVDKWSMGVRGRSRT
jgi:hypothetical protein